MTQHGELTYQRDHFSLIVDLLPKPILIKKEKKILFIIRSNDYNVTKKCLNTEDIILYGSM